MLDYLFILRITISNFVRRSCLFSKNEFNMVYRSGPDLKQRKYEFPSAFVITKISATFFQTSMMFQWSTWLLSTFQLQFRISPLAFRPCFLFWLVTDFRFVVPARFIFHLMKMCRSRSPNHLIQFYLVNKLNHKSLFGLFMVRVSI